MGGTFSKSIFVHCATFYVDNVEVEYKHNIVKGLYQLKVNGNCEYKVGPIIMDWKHALSFELTDRKGVNHTIVINAASRWLGAGYHYTYTIDGAEIPQDTISFASTFSAARALSQPISPGRAYRLLSLSLWARG